MLFAVGLSAQTVYNDLDKVMLSKLGTTESAAIYAAAYRVVDFAYTPARSMAAVAYPNFFEAGRNGPRAALRLTASCFRATWRSVCRRPSFSSRSPG